MKRKKTWQEKLKDDKDLPKTILIEGEKARRWGEGTMVIPAPREVDALMKRIPKGKLWFVKDYERALAAL